MIFSALLVAVVVGVVLAVPSPNALGSDLTILINNDLMGSSSRSNGPRIMILANRKLCRPAEPLGRFWYYSFDPEISRIGGRCVYCFGGAVMESADRQDEHSAQSRLPNLLCELLSRPTILD